jgi:S-adenosylmethionine/arginine decarboxylase-like enzyme
VALRPRKRKARYDVVGCGQIAIPCQAVRSITDEISATYMAVSLSDL